MKTIWLVALLVAGLGGCASFLASGSVRAFPTSSEPISGGDLPYATGQLVLKDGCLRLVDDDGNSFLIEWPYGYSFREAADTIEVLDNEGQRKVTVGEALGLGGSVAEEAIQGVPCAGPVWYARSVEALDSGMAEDL